MPQPEPVLVELVDEPVPGPASRTQRTAGQVGAVLVVLELVLAFGWFGSASWTERQVLALTGLLTVAVSAGQNTVNWWRARAG